METLAQEGQSPSAGSSTPMMRQYISLKEKHRDAVLFFRLGDFYEMFQTDAIEVSRLLHLTLTKRNGVPMCGIPYHASSNYIRRLLEEGKKIAICEQVAIPEGGKGIAKREVVEVITPGLVTDQRYLDSYSPNYLAALGEYRGIFSLSYLDLSTGGFVAMTFSRQECIERIKGEMVRLSPREIVLQESLWEEATLRPLFTQIAVVNRLPDWLFNKETSLATIKGHFQVASLKSFGLNEDSLEVLSAGILLDYVKDNVKTPLPHIRTLTRYQENRFLALDGDTIRNLEIIKNLQEGTKKTTLYDTLDFTKTAAGSRTLADWLLNPLIEKSAIEQRHNIVEKLYHNQKPLTDMREALATLSDMERLASRLAVDKAHAKDLLSLGTSLKTALDLQHQLQRNHFPFVLLTSHEEKNKAKEVSATILTAIQDNPSILLTEGDIIREGYDAQLDRARMLEKNSKKILDAYVEEEKTATKMTNLKVRYNRIIGYFFEIRKNQLAQVPPYFIRRQSLVGGERFTTEQLIALETNLNTASGEAIELNRALFLDLCTLIKEDLDLILNVAHNIAELDCYQALATGATHYGYVRPKLSETRGITLRKGRHPVVEKNLLSGEFSPNDLVLGGDHPTFVLITGPNMAGKSTYLRQAALIVLMAQVGSFIPVEQGTIGLVDKIFCRVGATDNLARGQSTFLVEMSEAAHILRNATAKSLVVMDEVGRGTSTDDGLALAWSISEYLLDTLLARTLFATHHHELTRLEHPRLANLSMGIEEKEGGIVFLRQIRQGPADNSYGIYVASLAGIPREVIERAEQIMASLPNQKEKEKDSLSQEEISSPNASSHQGQLFDERDLICEELRQVALDKVTPLEALIRLTEWQKRLA